MNEFWKNDEAWVTGPGGLAFKVPWRARIVG